MRSAENPNAGQGPVLLDVGGDVGALLVTTHSSWEGVEIEIRPQLDHEDHDSHPHDSHQHDDPQHHLAHVEVLPRPTPGGFVHCAVFPDLSQGRYELSERPFSQVMLEVSVTGGEVTQASWPMPDRLTGLG